MTNVNVKAIDYNLMRHLSLGLALSCVAILLNACSPSSAYTRPGIQREEEKVMTGGYYWDKKTDPHRFSDARIEALIERAPLVDPMDGERAELYASQLVWALAATGDEHFAELLSKHPTTTRTKVLRFIEGLWQFYKMRYPATEALQVEAHDIH